MTSVQPQDSPLPPSLVSPGGVPAESVTQRREAIPDDVRTFTIENAAVEICDQSMDIADRGGIPPRLWDETTQECEWLADRGLLVWMHGTENGAEPWLAALAADRDAQIEALQVEVAHLNGAWRRADSEANEALRHVASLQEALAQKPYGSDLDAEIMRADAAESRARAAEGELRQVREAVRVVAGHLESGDPMYTAEDVVYDLRAVLASVPDGAGQPTPQAPTTTDEDQS